MAQKDPAINANDAEVILEGSAIALAPGCLSVNGPSGVPIEYCWGADATGSGLATADGALNYMELNP
jgi:hypothetical protein